MAKKKKKAAKKPATTRAGAPGVQASVPVAEAAFVDEASAGAAPPALPEQPRVPPKSPSPSLYGPGRALAAFVLAFALVALMESERVGLYLDGFAPNPAAEKTAAAVRNLARASGLFWLTERENSLVARYADSSVVGARRAAESAEPSLTGGAEKARSGGDEKGVERPRNDAESPERIYFLTAGALGEEYPDKPSLLEMEQRALRNIAGPAATVAPLADIPQPGASFRFGAAAGGARSLVATSRPVATVVPETSGVAVLRRGEPSILGRYGESPAGSKGSPGKAAASRERIGSAGPATVVTLATPPGPLGRDTPLAGQAVGPLTVETGESKMVLMVGDSMMGWGLGHVLERNLSRIPGIRVKRDTRPSTGLSRDDFFNWPKHLSELVDEYKPDLVVVCIGANDGQNIMDPSRKRHVVGTASWEATYQERAEEFIRVAQSKGAQVLWLGLPIVGVEPTGKVLRQLSLLQQAACSHLGTAEFLDNYLVLADKKGMYTAFMEGKNKKQIRVRHKDKIHVTTEGGGILAEHALPSILELLSRSSPLASSIR